MMPPAAAAAAMSSDRTAVFIASRVHQLDADVLDGEIVSLLSGQLRRALHFLQVLDPVAASIQPELLLAVRCYLFKHSLLKKGATLGQQMLGLQVVDSSSNSAVPSGRVKCYGLLTIAAPYFLERCGHLLPRTPLSVLSDLLKLADLINFVIFLTNGRFRSSPQRLLSISCRHSSAAIFDPINYDFMNRELLWFTLAEFLSFLLPVVNPIKVKNFVTKLVAPPPSGISVISAGIRCKSDLLACAVCSQSPVNAREIGCNHCFCYYCVMTACLADESYGFSCPKCNFHVGDSSEVRELYLKGF